MKRFLLLLLVSVTALCFVACGGSAAEKPDGNEPKDGTQTETTVNTGDNELPLVPFE